MYKSFPSNVSSHIAAMRSYKIKTSERVMSAFASLQRTLPAFHRNEMYQNYTAVLYQNKTALDICIHR